MYWKDWCWSCSSNTLATWWKQLTPWKRPWCWERLKAGGEGDDRGWDGWMASPTWWPRVWARPGSWWWTGKPSMLQSMGSQRVGHTERPNWTELIGIILHFFIFHFKCQKVQKWISTRCSTSFPSCEAPVPCPQTQMGVYVPLTVECLQLLPGGSEAQWGGGRQRREWEANVPRSQGRSSRATCHSACRRPVPAVGFQTSVISW